MYGCSPVRKKDSFLKRGPLPTRRTMWFSMSFGLYTYDFLQEKDNKHVKDIIFIVRPGAPHAFPLMQEGVGGADL